MTDLTCTLIQRTTGNISRKTTLLFAGKKSRAAARGSETEGLPPDAPLGWVKGGYQNYQN